MADDLQLARTVSDAVLATGGIQRLGTGRYAEVATYGVGDTAGEKVTGVVVSPGDVTVHIVARYPLAAPIPTLAQRVRERVVSKVEGRTATIVVEDLEVTQDEGL